MAHILLIEDDMFLRDMYQHIFTKNEFEIELADDGEAGITQAEAKTHDLILLDIMLPKKSGIEVLAALRLPESPAFETPILLLSNLGQESVIREAYRLGADGYLLKNDLLPQEVFEKVRDFLNGDLTKEDFLKTQSLD